MTHLENAIIAEKRTHKLRVITIDSLLSLVELKSEYGLSHQDILGILRPSGPKIDPIIDLITALMAEPEPNGAPNVDDEAPVDTGDAGFWLTPVKSAEDETADECIERLVGKGHYYAFGQRTAGRKHMKAGDRIAFYATTKGIVAHATLSSAPQKKSRPDGTSSVDYPWVCSLQDVQLYLDSPVVIDAKLRQQLNSFKGRDPEKPWAWFVQATRRVTEHDFGLLTGSKDSPH